MAFVPSRNKRGPRKSQKNENSCYTNSWRAGGSSGNMGKTPVSCRNPNQLQTSARAQIAHVLHLTLLFFFLSSACRTHTHKGVQFSRRGVVAVAYVFAAVLK